MGGRLENRQLVWVSSSRKDLEEFPDPVKETMLFALDLARVGEKHAKAKPFKGFSGASVLEIVQRGKDATFRTLYTVEFKEAIFVLHCFKKKSTEGIKTPKKEIDLIHNRYKQAVDLYKKLFKKDSK
jgi:phage-related protein